MNHVQRARTAKVQFILTISKCPTLKGSGYARESRTYTEVIAGHKEWSVLERGTSAVASRVLEVGGTVPGKLQRIRGVRAIPLRCEN